MKIGSKIPIATGSYSEPGITAGASIGYAQTQFQYEDVGVNIEMTPSIHYDRDITLKIKIEVSAESGETTIEGVTEPIISQRVVDQVIRLREGEASIVGGIQDNQESVNWTGIPGLSSIPILKYIFGSKDHTIQNDDIVFVVVPHIVRSQELDQANLRVIDTGEGQSVDLRHADDGAAPPATQTAPTVQPTALERTPMGSIPAQSAVEAAPAMLAQLRADMASSTGPEAPAQTSVKQPNTAAASAEVSTQTNAHRPARILPRRSFPLLLPAQAPAVAPPAPGAATPAPIPSSASVSPQTPGASFALNAPDLAAGCRLHISDPHRAQRRDGRSLYRVATPLRSG